MNTFAELMEGLRKRAANETIAKTLAGLDILDDIPDEGGRKGRIRLPYSSAPASCEKPWK
jgi:hypothetical protein